MLALKQLEKKRDPIFLKLILDIQQIKEHAEFLGHFFFPGFLSTIVMLISFRFKKFIITFICSYKLNILHDRHILLNFTLK